MNHGHNVFLNTKFSLFEGFSNITNTSQSSQTTEVNIPVNNAFSEPLSHGTDQSDKLDESGESRLPRGVEACTPDGATSLESDLETTSFGEDISSSAHDVYMVDAREAATLTGQYALFENNP